MLKKILIGAALLLAASPFSFGQGQRIGENFPIDSVLTTPGVISTVANAVINVCTHPANAVPCTNKATTFTDITLGTPCSTSTQITQPGSNSCVATTNNRGEWGAWIAPGNIDFTITVSGGNSFGPYVVTTGAGIPGSPSGGLQYNCAGALCGSVFIYNPSNIGSQLGTGNPCLSPPACATLVTSADSGISLRSTDLTNFVFFAAQGDVTPLGSLGGAGENILGQTTHAAESRAYAGQAFIGGTTVGGNCYGGGGASPPCGIAFDAEPGDVASNASNGQDAVGFRVLPAMNKTGGHNMNSVSGFMMETPLNITGGGVAVTQTAVNLWGLEIQDLQDLGSTMTAGIHIEAQTNPSAHAFAIKLETGAGPSQFQAVSSGTITPITAGVGTLGTTAFPWNSLNLGPFNQSVQLSSNALADRTAQFPDANGTISYSVSQYCGATSGAAQACANTVNFNPIVIWGEVT